MGMFDNLASKARDLAGEHGGKIAAGLDKAKEFVDEKTGGRFGSQTEAGVDAAKDQLGVESTEGGASAESTAEGAADEGSGGEQGTA